MSDETAAPSPEDLLSGLRDTLKPQLRLFLSADIVGSTAFKQRRDEDGWFDMVLRFYQLAEGAFMRHWEVGSGSLAKRPTQRVVLYGDAPVLWKTIGDEVTFSKQITHPAQVMTTLHAWIAALGDLRKLLMKSEQDQLDVKATAWLADFPMRNREVALRTGRLEQASDADPDDRLTWRNDTLLNEYGSEAGAHLIKDYVGPSIDTGFRLAAGASPRRMAISIELAYVIAGETMKLETDDHYKIAAFQIRPLILKYDQMSPLKGVLGGAPYPMIWVDVQPREPLHQFEDDLRGVTAAPAEKIRGFAEAYMKTHADKLCTLFMKEDAELPDEYGAYPADKLHRLVARDAKLKKLHEKWTFDQAALAEIDDPTIAPEPTDALADPVDGARSMMDLRILLDGTATPKRAKV